MKVPLYTSVVDQPVRIQACRVMMYGWPALYCIHRRVVFWFTLTPFFVLTHRQYGDCEPSRRDAVTFMERFQVGWNRSASLETMPLPPPRFSPPPLFASRYPSFLISRASLQTAVDKNPTGPAMVTDSKTWSWEDYHADTKACAKSMIKAGLDEHHGAAIVGFTPEWFIAYNVHLRRGLASGVYTTSTPEALQYVSVAVPTLS